MARGLGCLDEGLAQMRAEQPLDVVVSAGHNIQRPARRVFLFIAAGTR
jgi:hypothetical protein